MNSTQGGGQFIGNLQIPPLPPSVSSFPWGNTAVSGNTLICVPNTISYYSSLDPPDDIFFNSVTNNDEMIIKNLAVFPTAGLFIGLPSGHTMETIAGGMGGGDTINAVPLSLFHWKLFNTVWFLIGKYLYTP
jgi:hypothetical protein